jgi:magnesium and cobalt transporter
MNGFGHMPKRGETLDLGDFHFKVLRASSRQIYLLQVSRHEASLAKTQAGTAGGS